jgi:hypothetical protein
VVDVNEREVGDYQREEPTDADAECNRKKARR